MNPDTSAGAGHTGDGPPASVAGGAVAESGCVSGEESRGPEFASTTPASGPLPLPTTFPPQQRQQNASAYPFPMTGSRTTQPEVSRPTRGGRHLRGRRCRRHRGRGSCSRRLCDRRRPSKHHRQSRHHHPSRGVVAPHLRLHRPPCRRPRQHHPVRVRGRATHQEKQDSKRLNCVAHGHLRGEITSSCRGVAWSSPCQRSQTPHTCYDPPTRAEICDTCAGCLPRARLR